MVAASPTQIDHGLGVCFRIGTGAPPMPGIRTKATRLPSADQRGEKSRLVVGAMKRRGLDLASKIPMNE